MKGYIELSDLLGTRSLEERMLDLARRLKAYRRRMKLTQLQLSDRSGVPYGTVKLFERTGRISIESLWLLCIALDCDDQMDRLFTDIRPTPEEIRGRSG